MTSYIIWLVNAISNSPPHPELTDPERPSPLRGETSIDHEKEAWAKAMTRVLKVAL